MHNFWRNTGLVLLIFGEGVLTIAGGLLGVPTIISLFYPATNLGAIPNFLQSAQLTLLVIGIIAFVLGMA